MIKSKKERCHGCAHKFTSPLLHTCYECLNFEEIDNFCEGTQENIAGPRLHQKQIQIKGKKIWADPEMVSLLKALNDIGLITRSHCAGHTSDEAWVILRMENILEVAVRNRGAYKEVLLTWRKK